MSIPFPTSPATLDAFDASWMHDPVTYLTVAAFCLVVALHFLRRALSPIGALIQAVAAAALVAFALVVAFAMLVIAAATSMR